MLLKPIMIFLPMYVTRSMSRAGTPTDSGAMESINGWIKAELFMDFHVTGDRPVEAEINEYITFFNEQRPAYALNYLTRNNIGGLCALSCSYVYSIDIGLSDDF